LTSLGQNKQSWFTDSIINMHHKS